MDQEVLDYEIAEDTKERIQKNTGMKIEDIENSSSERIDIIIGNNIGITMKPGFEKRAEVVGNVLVALQLVKSSEETNYEYHALVSEKE